MRRHCITNESVLPLGSVPHFRIVFVQVVPVAAEGRFEVKGNLELRVWQFFNNVKHVPPGLIKFIGRVPYRLNVDPPELSLQW